MIRLIVHYEQEYQIKRIYLFGILLGKDPADFTTVNDVIEAVKLELQD